MQFQFDSFTAFIEMGRHGSYVWACYLSVLVVWLYLFFAPTFETKSFFKKQKALQRRVAGLEQENREDD